MGMDTVYTLEIYGTDDVEVAIHALSSPSPFASFSVGDYVRVPATHFPERRLIEAVEHRVQETHDRVEHAVCLFTRPAGETRGGEIGVELSKKERFLMASLLQLRELLDPEEARFLAPHREAIEAGYELHYSWLFESFYDPMTRDECKEVINALEVYRAIAYSVRHHPQPPESIWYPFPGYDGNNETSQMLYAHYFTVRLGRYSELDGGRETTALNSHRPSRRKYSAMHDLWVRTFERGYELTEGQVRELLDVDAPR